MFFIMEYYRVVAYYDYGGLKKISHKALTFEECKRWAEENQSVSVKVSGRMIAVSFTEYVFIKVCEEEVLRRSNG